MNLTFSLYGIPPYTVLNGHGPKAQLTKSLMKDVKDYLLAALPSLGLHMIWPPEEEHGREKVSGNWTGVIGVLQRQDADLGLLPFGLSMARHRVIDFTTPFFYSYASIVSRTPEAQKDPFAYLKTLNPEVWVLVHVAVIIVSFLYTKSERIADSKEKDRSKRPSSFARDFDHILWNFFGTIWNQTPVFDSKRTSQSFLLSFWWFFRIILMTAYCGTLIASFAKVDEIKIDTLEDVLARKELRPLVQQNSVFMDYFASSPFSLPQAIWARIRRLNGSLAVPVLQHVSSFDSVVSGKAVLIHEVLSLDQITSKHCSSGKRKFYRSQNALFYTPLALAARKNLSLHIFELINTKMTYYTATHRMTPLLRELAKGSLPCLWERKLQEGSAISMKDFEGVAFLYSFGTLFSIVAFVAEIIGGPVFRRRFWHKKTAH